jgi:hypothetical protein
MWTDLYNANTSTPSHAAVLSQSLLRRVDHLSSWRYELAYSETPCASLDHV